MKNPPVEPGVEALYKAPALKELNIKGNPERL